MLREDFFHQYVRQVFPDGKGLFAMIQTFCDETSNADVYCVGGYLFKPERATEFQDTWEKRMLPLRAKGIEFFHASPCAAGKTVSNREAFANLSEPERMALFRDLIDLIHGTAEFGYVAELKHDEYHAWIKQNPSISGYIGSQYSVACFYCLSGFKAWISKAGHQDGVDYEFEAGDKKFMDEAGALMSKIASNPALREAYRYERHGFGFKGLMRQLEAADLLLWAYQKLEADHRRYGECVRVSRGLFRNSPVPHHVAVLSEFSITFQSLFNSEHGLASRQIQL